MCVAMGQVAVGGRGRAVAGRVLADPQEMSVGSPAAFPEHASPDQID